MPDNNNRYHVLLAEKDGHSLQTVLDLLEGKPFGRLGNPSKDGKYFVCGCNCPMSNIEDHTHGNSDFPEPSDFIDPSYDTYITDLVGSNPENITHNAAKKVASNHGEGAGFWKDPETHGLEHEA